MRENDCGLCYSSYDYIDKNDGKVYHPYIVPDQISYNELLKENVIGLATVILRKSALGGIRFDSEMFHEDFALWLTLLRSGVVARSVPEVLVHIRIGGRSENKWNAMKNRWRVYRKSEKLPFVKSCWYLVSYVMTGLKKYRNEKKEMNK